MRADITGIRGWYFNGSDFIEGDFAIYKDGGNIIIEEGQDAYNHGIIEGIIMPSYFNAHVHTADLALYYTTRSYISHDLVAMVSPPDGIKHRILQEHADTLTKYIVKAIYAMHHHGITAAIDFREGGISGVNIAREARNATNICFDYLIYGRPQSMDDIGLVVGSADGIGLPSLGDLPLDLIKRTTAMAHSHGLKVAIHFSELGAEDTDTLIDIAPDIAVHLCHMAEEDMERIKQCGILPVFCPRTNMTFSTLDAVAKAIALDMDFAIGTDNMMLANGNILSDVELLWRYLIGKKRQKQIEHSPVEIARTLLRAICVIPWEFLGMKNRAYLIYESKANAIWEFAMHIMPSLRPRILC